MILFRCKDRLLRRLEYAEASFIFNLCNAQLRRFIRVKPFRNRFFIIRAAIADLIFLTFFLGTILSLLLNDWSDCLLPVSYTHLDVYKRQAKILRAVAVDERQIGPDIQLVDRPLHGKKRCL